MRLIFAPFPSAHLPDFVEPMSKNRQKQTADICKQHLREKYRDQRGLVEEFILEFEGDRKNCDVTRWDRFTDIKDIKKEMLKRLETLVFLQILAD